MRVHFWSPYLSHITRSTCISKRKGKQLGVMVNFKESKKWSGPNLIKFLGASLVKFIELGA